MYKTLGLIIASVLTFSFNPEKIGNQTIPSPPFDSLATVQRRILEFENNFPVYWFKEKDESNPTLKDRMKYYQVKGLSMAVIKDFKIDWAKGYGLADEAKQIPVTTETIFSAGSVSKSLHAVGVMKLVQEKKLDLYSDINKYLQSWNFPYENVSQGKTISLANLLSHTGGLSVHGVPGYCKDNTMPTVLETIDGKWPAKNVAVRSVSKPGVRFQYSGGGTMISQLMVMDVTQMRYTDYMQGSVFESLGMKNSFFNQPIPKDKEDEIATGYLEDGRSMQCKYYITPQAAGGMWTTPTDLCKFIIEIQRALKGSSEKLLKKETAQLMTTPYIDKESALGVFITKKGAHQYFGHSGANYGFRCQYYGDLENGNGVVVMVNTNNGGIVEEIVNNIARIYDWKDFAPERYASVKSPLIHHPIELLDQYAGIYRSGDECIRIYRKGNTLCYQGFQGGGINAWPIHFTSTHSFFNKESRAEKQFQFDSNGRVNGFIKSMNGKEIDHFRKVAHYTLPDSLANTYCGHYQMWGVTAQVLRQNAALFLKLDDEYIMEMYFLSEKEFVLFGEEIYQETFSFTKDPAGNIEGITEKKGKLLIHAPRIIK